VRQQRLIIWFVGLAWVGCGEAPIEPTIIPLGELVGTWSLQLTDTAGCASPVSPIEPITLWVTLEPYDVGPFVFLDQTTSTWSNNIGSGWVGGWFPRWFDRGALLNLASGSFAPGVDPNSMAQLFGVLDASLTLRGVLQDPLNGGQPPLLGAQPCTYRAVAHHQ
jgi:hypothetical protein